MGDLLSLSEHMDEPYLLLDSGDIIEGTGFSDATSPHGKLVFEAIKHIPFDGLTVGNHDIGLTPNVDYIARDFAPFWNGSYITSNVLYEGSALGGSQYKVLNKDGHSILLLGFLYNFKSGASNAEVVEVQNSVKQNYFKEAMGKDVEIIIVLAHIAADQDELRVIHSAIREYQTETPLVMLIGHSHVERHGQLDDNAYYLESDHYFRHIGLVQLSISSATGDIDSFDYSYIEGSRSAFAKLVGLGVEQFPTENGIALDEIISKEYDSLNLTTVFGCAEFTYSKRYSPKTKLATIFDLYVDSAMAHTLYSHYPTANQPLFILNRGAIRDSLYSGVVIEDDLLSIIPFDDLFMFVEGISGEDMSVFTEWLKSNPGPDGSTFESPSDRYTTGMLYHKSYSHGVWVFENITLEPTNTYDFVSDSYDAPFFSNVLKLLFGGRKYAYKPYPCPMTSDMRYVLRSYIEESPEFKCVTM